MGMWNVSKKRVGFQDPISEIADLQHVKMHNICIYFILYNIFYTSYIKWIVSYYRFGQLTRGPPHRKRCFIWSWNKWNYPQKQHQFKFSIISLKLTASLPLKIGHRPKRNIFQPPTFRCFREGISIDPWTRLQGDFKVMWSACWPWNDRRPWPRWISVGVGGLGWEVAIFVGWIWVGTTLPGPRMQSLPPRNIPN